MSFLGKVYNSQRDEKYKEYLKSLGIPEESLDYIVNIRPIQKFEKNGDEYVFTAVINGTDNVLKFKSGVEFEEKCTNDIISKTTFTVDGDVIKQVQNFPDGRSIVIERCFSGNEMTMVLKNNSWDGTAYRYYKAA